MSGSASQNTMDAIFNGAAVTINGLHDFSNAVMNTYNGIKNGFSDSRRNDGYYPNAAANNPQYAPRVTYDYAYADSPYQNPSPYGYQNGSMNNGYYPGFTNPNYGMICGSVYSSQPTYTNNYNDNTPKGAMWG